MGKIGVSGRISFVSKLGILIAGTVAVLSVSALASARFPDLTLSFLANFASGSLGGSVDKLGIGMLLRGDAQVAGTNPAWEARRGEYKLSVTRPSTAPASPVSAGLFATRVDFPAGSVVGLRATFIGPVGPHGSTDIWAVALNAKTGDEHDLGSDKRAVAGLQIRGAGARLNTVGSTKPANLPNISQDDYDAIFDPDNPRPFTLELLIDRASGDSMATLKIGETVISKVFEPAQFPADSGPAITSVGPAIAIASGAGKTASVRVRSFEIFAPKNHCTQNQLVC